MSSDPPKTLTAPDYVVFGVTLTVSAAIGIFFAVRDRKAQAGTDDYLLGGRSMGMVPVGFSLAVSYLSAIALLGTPAEMYVYGAMFWWFVVALFMGTVVTSEVFLPVFYRLNISSLFEYLELRYNRAVRLLATLAYLIQTVLYVGIVIYAPSLALNAVTGFNLWAAILSTGSVCIFYTTLGGLKAVIWTDAFQAVVMVMGFLAILIQGSIDQGGFEKVWRICEEGGRTEFLYADFDPRYRHTIWSILFGGTFLTLCMYSVSQSQVQRYVSCKSIAHAKGALFINWFGIALINSLCFMNGAIIYAVYRDCDPIASGKVAAPDQLVPYVTLDLFRNYPGLPGLIVSCIFSGSLSTVSSGINAMACVTIEDFVKPFTKWSDAKYTWLSKGLVVLFGVLCIAMAYLASILGGLLEAAFSILSLISGPLVGLFTMGMIFPFSNSIGAIFGLASGIKTTVWLYIGQSIYPPDPKFARVLPRDTSGCYKEELNSTYPWTTQEFTETVGTESLTVLTSTSNPDPPIADFYAVSYLYYSFLGFAAAVIVGLIVSLITGGWRQRAHVNPSLLHFLFDHWSLSWLPNGFRKAMRCGVDVEKWEQKKAFSSDDATSCSGSIIKKPLPTSSGSDNKAYIEDFDHKMGCSGVHDYEEEATAL